MVTIGNMACSTLIENHAGLTNGALLNTGGRGGEEKDMIGKKALSFNQYIINHNLQNIKYMLLNI